MTRLALRKAEAVEALGVSDETFDKYIRPSLPVVRCGSVRLYPVSALQAWLEDQAVAPLDEQAQASPEALAFGRKLAAERGW